MMIQDLSSKEQGFFWTFGQGVAEKCVANPWLLIIIPHPGENDGSVLAEQR
jgi:hypothetical protein